MIKPYFILLTLILLIACQKDRVLDLPKDQVPEFERFEGFVDFSNPVIGQKSMYVKYQSVCSEMNEEFEYTGDTVVFEIAEKNGDLIFTEYYTDGSPAQISYPHQKPAEYPFTASAEHILIPDRFSSNLFFFYGNDTIRINPEDQVELSQNGCLLDIGNSTFVGDEIGHIENFTMGSLEVKDKIAVSCVPIINLDAYLLYNKHHLYMSHTVSSDTIFGGGGFEVWSQIIGYQLLTD